MHPFFGRLIVNFVLCLICYIAYSSQIFIIWPWYGSTLSVELITLLAPFNFFVGLLLWNYFLCVNTDPGCVPSGWKPDTHTDGYEVKKLTGTPRFCRMCKNFKPPRAHHYAFLEWITTVPGLTTAVMHSMGPHYWEDPSTLELVMIITNYVACVPVLLAVGGFSLYHFYGLTGNSTTIEGWEKDKTSVMVRKGKMQEVKFPYDLGVRRNIESVLGSSLLLWCCPSKTPGSGLKYELSSVDGESWPPRDPTSNSSSVQVNEKASPWTYENESLNPDLRPSNSHLRKSTSRRNRIPGASSVPPYHPDYQEGEYPPEVFSASSENSFDEGGTTRVRRGSEGYEVLSENREVMLKRYLEEIGEEPGRYIRYIPQVEDESSSDDDVPLAEKDILSNSRS